MFPVASALRERLREGYTLADARADLLAGLVVAMVALPLGMALAIASKTPPQHGLYTVIVAGIVVALLGGSRFQVTGPTAAFVVILGPIVVKFGIAGLLLAGLMAGVVLVVLGLARMGQLISFIPHPVTTGFTSGIAVVIATIQLTDLFGLTLAHDPESYVSRLVELWRAAPGWKPAELGVGLFTLAFLALWPSRLNNKLPAPLVGLACASLLGVAIARFAGVQVDTIGSRFHYESGGVTIGGIPPWPPQFVLPWTLAGPGGGAFALTFETVRALVPSAFAIALLGAIESLLSAVVADAMAQTRHDPDAELVASGIGNILCPFFGGIAATGAIARTATNIRSGARSPLATVVHGVVVLLAIVFFAPVVAYLPMAALAGLLLRIAYNISDVKHFRHMVRVAPRSDVVVLLTCFGLTVLFDMVVGVMVGIVLAALLLVRRIATITSAELFEGARHPALKEPLPPGVLLYEIAGPFLFGAAQRCVDAIISRRAPMERLKVAIFLMRNIPTMDVTGLVAFETMLGELGRMKSEVILVGVQGQPLTLMRKAGLLRPENPAGPRIVDELENAVVDARRVAGPPGKDDYLTTSGRWRKTSSGRLVKGDAAGKPPDSSPAP